MRDAVSSDESVVTTSTNCARTGRYARRVAWDYIARVSVNP